MGINSDIRPRRNFNNLKDDGFSVPKKEEKKENKPVDEYQELKLPSENVINDETPKPTEPKGSKELLENQFFGQTKQAEKTPSSISEEPKKSSGRFAKFVIWFIVIGLIAATAIYRNPFKQKTDSTDIKSTDNSTNYSGEVITQDYVNSNSDTSSTSTSQTPAATPSATTTPETSTPPTSTPAATTPAATPTTVNNASVTIKVLNGNGITGDAAKVKNTLITAGFTISFTGNAKSFSYAKTYIYYQTGKEAEANLVKNSLVDRTVVLQQSDSITGTYNIVVVVGKT